MEQKDGLRDLEGILETALAKEKAALRFYSGLLVKHSLEGPVRELVERLKDEEYKHVRMIDEMMVNMRRGKDVIRNPS
jgi:rubrerythrin